MVCVSVLCSKVDLKGQVLLFSLEEICPRTDKGRIWWTLQVFLSRKKGGVEAF